MAATGDLVGLSCPPFSRMATRQSRRPALQVLPEVNQMGDRMTSQIEQQASGMQGHLPECFMAARLGVDTYAPDVLAQMKRAGCICDRLRSCEERLRQGWCVSSCGNAHYTIGYEEGLDAARDAVAAQHLRTDDGQILRQGGDWEHAVDRALAAIDALRDQPADQTGYNLPDAR